MDDMVRLILIPRCGSSCTQQDFVKHVLQEPRDTYPPELICEFENISDNFVFLGCEVDWSNRPFQLRLHNDFKTSQKKLRFHHWFSNVPRHICKSCIMGAWNRVHTFCSNFASAFWVSTQLITEFLFLAYPPDVIRTSLIHAAKTTKNPAFILASFLPHLFPPHPAYD